MALGVKIHDVFTLSKHREVMRVMLGRQVGVHPVRGERNELQWINISIMAHNKQCLM